MPYTKSWSNRVYDIIQSVCRDLELECVRGDEDLSTPDVLEHIWSRLRSTAFIIADISGQSPNVMYEVGLGHAIGKPICLLSQSTEDIPFDLRTRRIVDYKLGARGDQGLRSRLTTALQMMKERYVSGSDLSA